MKMGKWRGRHAVLWLSLFPRGQFASDDEFLVAAAEDSKADSRPGLGTQIAPT